MAHPDLLPSTSALQDHEKQYVGFATLPNQVHRKSVKKGFDFTLMVAGETAHGWRWLGHVWVHGSSPFSVLVRVSDFTLIPSLCGSSPRRNGPLLTTHNPLKQASLLTEWMFWVVKAGTEGKEGEGGWRS